MEEKQKRPNFPWKIDGRFKTFEEADKKRNSLLESDNTLQAKVKRAGLQGTEFIVKVRVHPDHMPKPNSKKRKNKNYKKNSK